MTDVRGCAKVFGMTDAGVAQWSHDRCRWSCKGPVEGCLHKWIDRGSPAGTAPRRACRCGLASLARVPFRLEKRRRYGSTIWLLVVGWFWPHRPGHPLRNPSESPLGNLQGVRDPATPCDGAKGRWVDRRWLSPCLVGRPRPAPASPAHVASLVRAPFALRRGRFGDRRYRVQMEL